MGNDKKVVLLTLQFKYDWLEANSDVMVGLCVWSA